MNAEVVKEVMTMDWLSIATIVGSVVAVMTFFFTWMNGNISRLDADMKAIAAESKEDSRVLHARLDASQAALNARVDTTQTILMKMVEKLGK